MWQNFVKNMSKSKETDYAANGKSESQMGVFQRGGRSTCGISEKLGVCQSATHMECD